MKLELPPAHPKQYELTHAFELHNARFVVGAAGTKFGKTFGCTNRIIEEAWNRRDSLDWWVAPSYAQAKIAYTQIVRLLPKGFFQEHKADLAVSILEPDGSPRSRIEFKSGDNPDTLRGYGVNFVVMDEAARMPYEAFVSVMTTLTQTMGRGMFISTPKGRGWFYDLFQKGEILRDKNPNWFSMRMPTWSNPHVTLAAINEMKETLPEDVFRQEVAAHFLLESAGVFRNIKACIKPGDFNVLTGVSEEPQRGHSYIMGVDLARLRDFTVLTIMDQERRHVVYHERFNQIDWSVQYHRIIQAAKKYNNAVTWMDSTGIGDPILATVRGAGIRVEPYQIGGTKAKQQLIEKLRVNLEHSRISFPNIPLMIRELENYEYNISDAGTIKYEAPSGSHDDCVISLALANWGADTGPWVYKYRSVRGI